MRLNPGIMKDCDKLFYIVKTQPGIHVDVMAQTAILMGVPAFSVASRRWDLMACGFIYNTAAEPKRFWITPAGRFKPDDVPIHIPPEDQARLRIRGKGGKIAIARRGGLTR